MTGLIFMGGILAVAGAAGPPPKGGSFPVFSLPAPQNAAEKAYLGLKGEGPFKLAQIKAKVLIIEIFSMYCPFCQNEAPHINELYQTIEKNPGLKGRVKLIGIGAGNSPYEVQVFKETYQVPFPLLADEDFAVHKLLGEVRTPYFFALKMGKKAAPRVIYSELGGLKGIEAFLEGIRKGSGL
jgi:peroxiredoxin